MIEAALSGAMGSWSPSAIFASFGNAIDRIADRAVPADQGAPDTASTGPAASFERALAEEMLKAGDIDRLDIAFDLQNGTLLGKAVESHQNVGKVDRFDVDAAVRTDATDVAAATGPYQRVGFGDDDASARLSSGGRDRFDQRLDGNDPAAVWIGDRIVDHPAFRGDGSSFVDDPFIEPVPTGRVFFNGDGRPIILPQIDVGRHDEPHVDDDFGREGDLMILPDGAVLAYDPWTAAADGDLVH